MGETVFKGAVGLIGLAFAAVFMAVVVPPLIADPDVVGAFAAGFVNPYASGYSSDVIACWALLAVWVVYERAALGVRHGWLCVLLGLIPGVAVGFALYLLLRMRQVSSAPA